MSVEKNYGIANEFATELIQRIMNQEISIEDAMHIVISIPSFLLYRTLPEEVVDNSLDKHIDIVKSVSAIVYDYLVENKMLKHEYIACMSSILETTLGALTEQKH